MHINLLSKLKKKKWTGFYKMRRIDTYASLYLAFLTAIDIKISYEQWVVNKLTFELGLFALVCTQLS